MYYSFTCKANYVNYFYSGETSNIGRAVDETDIVLLLGTHKRNTKMKYLVQNLKALLINSQASR